MTPCSMHPTRAAHWYCPNCDQSFCPDCVIKQEAGSMAGNRLLRSCPKCLAETRWIGTESLIKPFWERLPAIFLYPMKPATLIYMAVLALGALIFWSWIVKFVCWVLLLNYAYVALKKTARGDLRPPGVDEMIAANFVDVVIPVVKQALLVLVLAGIGMFVAGELGPAAGILYMLLALFFLPSMIIVLVNTESLISALNPGAFLFLPVKIGRAYFVMFVFLALLAGAPGALLNWFMPYLPVLPGVYLLAFAENYYTVVSYHLMGYVLLQYHETIGYELSADDFKQEKGRRREAPDDPAARESKIIAVLCREGRFAEAAAHVRQWRRSGGEFSAALAEQYFQLLKNSGDKTAMREHAPVYLDFAVAAGKKKETLEAFEACREADPDYVPQAPAMFKIGEYMAEAGRFREALKIFSRLTKTHPDADEVPLSYFRAAQLYNERFMDAERARKIMKTLMKKYPEHTMRSKFQNYLQYLGGA